MTHNRDSKSSGPQFLAALIGLALTVPGVAAAHDWNDDDDDDDSSGDHGYYDHDRWEVQRAATLSVQNQFDGEADVVVDHRYLGRVGGDRTMSFSVDPGMHEVVVTRPGTAYVLLSTRMRLYGGSTTALPVYAPAGTLRVANGGEVPLKLEADRSSVWIAPGATGTLVVETGNVDVVASIKEPHGEWRALEKTMWVEPGRTTLETLRPDPTVVVVTNRDRVSLRALVDGIDAGVVPPGDTRRIWVRPGSTRVTLVDLGGRVRSSSTVFVSKGKEVRLLVDARYPVSTTVVAVSNGGPARPGYGPEHGPGDGCAYH